MNKPCVWVIILNWNGGDETLACLASLRGSTYLAHILVVDNNSHDDSPARISAGFPEVELLKLGANLGYSKSVNIGIRYALDGGADYVFLLNNDTRVAADMLDQLLAYAVANPRCGLLSPLIYQLDHPDRFWVVGGRWLIYNIVNVGWDTPDTGQYSKPTPFDVVFGTALLIKRQLFDTIGYFDERFFVYYEDVDFGLRARRAGYSAIVVPAARLWHKGSHSTHHRPALREFYLAYNRVTLFRKHLSGIHLLVFFLLQLRADLRMVWVMLREGKLLHVLAYSCGMVCALL